MSLEATATQIRSFSAQAIPDLLHTADYAAAAHRATRPALTGRQIAGLLELQPGRQELLNQDRYRLRLLIHEPAALIDPAH
jgi:hypothetical protein